MSGWGVLKRQRLESLRPRSNDQRRFESGFANAGGSLEVTDVSLTRSDPEAAPSGFAPSADARAPISNRSPSDVP